MYRAEWNEQVIAESDQCEIVENNTYFPPDSINREYFQSSDTHSYCPWKGEASYFTLNVNGQENKDAAWYYPNPKEKALQIKNYIAFWRGVEVSKV